MTAYVFAAGLMLCAVLACVYVLLDGEARFRRASRPDPVPSDPVFEAALDEVDRHFRSLPSTPPCALRADDPVWRAGQLPLTWRERRALIDDFERIVNSGGNS